MDPSQCVARLLMLGVCEQTEGVGIEVVRNVADNREQVFAKPVPLNAIERLAQSQLSPRIHTVQAFAPSGSLIGQWAFNGEVEKTGRVSACVRHKQEKETPAPILTAAIKAEKKAEAKARKAEREREQLAKAPKALLPMMKAESVCLGMNRVSTKLERWVAPVPMLESDSNVSVMLFKADGSGASFPIHKGLYTSAVSRGKALIKEAEKRGENTDNIDSEIYIKRLLAELMLGEKSGERQHQGAMRQGEVKGHVAPVVYVRALLSSSTKQVSITRTEALEVQATPKADIYKRKVKQICHKPMSPFGGKKGYGWRMNPKDTKVSFSRG